MKIQTQFGYGGNFVDLLNKHAPVSTIRSKGNSAPYLTKDIKSMMFNVIILSPRLIKQDQNI